MRRAALSEAAPYLISRSLSPRHPTSSRVRHRSRSYSPAPKHRDDYSASPRRQSAHRSPRVYPQGRGEKQSHRSYSPKHSDDNGKQPRRSRSPTDYREGHGEDRRHKSYSPKSDVAGRNGATYNYEKEPRRPSSYSPSGSRSRSTDSSPGHNH